MKIKQGFTIVELLIYMVLVTILITVMTSIFLSALETQIASQTSSSALISGRFIMTRLSYDIHRASAISAPASLGQTSSSLTLTIGGQNYVYALSGNNLTLTAGGNTYVLNDDGTEMSGVGFTRIGNASGKPTVQILFTVTGLGSEPPEVRTFEETLGTR